MGEVEVTLTFYGYLCKTIENKSCHIQVPTTLNEALVVISDYLNNELSVNVPYTLLLNQRNTKLFLKDKENYILSKGDVFTIIPIISGG